MKNKEKIIEMLESYYTIRVNQNFGFRETFKPHSVHAIRDILKEAKNEE